MGAAERGRIAFVLCLLLALCCLGINRELWTPDEPREAELSREMLLAPSVVPTLDARPFIEKPPLYYWTVAGLFALTGGPSVVVARGVSNLASFLTLVVVFLWGRREFSTSVGLAAAVGLVTSVQFMISSHWILIDPLLMLSTTLAAWAGWELVEGRGRSRAVAFYVTLAIALWIKGLIGPVLIGAGLLTYAGFSRSAMPIRRVYPITGVVVICAATAVLAFLIYVEAGQTAVREWLWVNHVQRFIAPQNTGHDQPFYYYVLAVPIAVFPWWLPFADCLRPSRWRANATAWRPAKRYLGAVSLGMVAILSASATKRGVYLLPMLPLLFLLLAAHSVEWWQRESLRPLRSRREWWFQVVFAALIAIGPTVAAIAYLRIVDPLGLGFLAGVAALTVTLVVYSRRDDRQKALTALAGYAVAGVIGLLVVTAHLAAPQKDLRPFVQWIDAEMPPRQPVYAVGDIDETVYGIVPFVTTRPVASISLADVAMRKPPYVLVQDKNGGRTAPDLGYPYERLRDANFGSGRYFAIWRRIGGSASDPQ